MTYTPAPVPYDAAHLVSLFLPRYAMAYSISTASSAAWTVANGAFYFPLAIQRTMVARRLWWANGATVSASYNVDVGLYLDAGQKPGARLVSSGSTAQGTASTLQFVDIADTAVPAGVVWLGMACSSTSATFFRTSLAGGAADAALGFQEASALPLPATATPAEYSQTSRVVFLCGFATTASP
jgi:hypothetical protein